MSIETRLQGIIGAQAMQICILQEQCDKLTAEVKTLEATIQTMAAAQKEKENEAPSNPPVAGVGQLNGSPSIGPRPGSAGPR